jgi:hypothetical protein
MCGEHGASFSTLGIASNSRFKLFSDTVNSRVETSLIAIETARLYHRFRYSSERSVSSYRIQAVAEAYAYA